ncbi:DinB family protein [Corynebacterium sp. UBA2622]|uniref:DinB family protein n=1 Tax=Corynebacterium sp. UBA2622 TaxID=1946393 RepID=UPI0025BDE7A4|nr:DinB family protein [Corynebacterium sp. UBA2622]
MNATDTVHDLVERTRFSLGQLPELDAAALNAHPGGHPNSAAWLLWHTGRELDMQLSALSSAEEVWVAGGFRDRLALGEIGDTMGYGHTPDQARAIGVDDASLVTAYISAVLDRVDGYAAATADSAWDEAVDQYEGEDVSRQARVTSILIDALEHIAQAAYIGGMTGH